MHKFQNCNKRGVGGGLSRNVTDYGGDKMENTSQQKKAQALTQLLKRINKGTDPILIRKDASRLLLNLSPKDIAAAEQNLISAGYSARLVQQLSAAFVLMGLLEDRKSSLRVTLPSDHVLRRIMAEHDMLKCFMSDLKDLTETIDRMPSIKDTTAEFRRLAHIIEHLDAMEEHIEREEDVIFPFLKKHGWASLCRSAKSDHIYIRVATGDLIRIIETFDSDNIEEFKVRLKSIVKYLCPTMRDHIFQEDNIMYPIAVEVINDDTLWKKLKTVCDEIGYCGVHL